jgi:SpoVK/Ycf46/Vps4 family AAA+-type ATPase
MPYSQRRHVSLGNNPYIERSLTDASRGIISVDTQEIFIAQMRNAMEFFFSIENNDCFSEIYPELKDSANFPFKGFILDGPPGSGKTEAVVETGRRLYLSLAREGLELKLFHVNSANINTKAFGDSEQRLKEVFRDAKAIHDAHQRTILLFDDIDSLLLKRDDENAKEWTMSLNGVFFHELDQLITTKTMVVATTNLPERLDPAVRSRLALREAPAPSFEELLKVAEASLPFKGAKGKSQAELLSEAEAILRHEIEEKGTPPSFRLARQTAIETVLKFVAGWSESE